jgi:hypothetical protein
MRCPSRPCNDIQGHCWQDPHGGRHYKLLTARMRKLATHLNEGNKFESHHDVPDTIRQQLYAEADQRTVSYVGSSMISPCCSIICLFNHKFSLNLCGFLHTRFEEQLLLRCNRLRLFPQRRTIHEIFHRNANVRCGVFSPLDTAYREQMDVLYRGSAKTVHKTPSHEAVTTIKPLLSTSPNINRHTLYLSALFRWRTVAEIVY